MANADTPLEAEPELDPAAFDKLLDLPALRVPAQRISELQKDKDVKAIMYRRQGVRNIIPTADGNGADRLILLEVGTDSASLPGRAAHLLQDGVVSLTRHSLSITYKNVTADEALRKVLPHGVEVPRGFETVGHLAHFNLRADQWPFRRMIGKIILDKNPSLRTVVTKVGSLSNEFRNMEVEVLAGQDDTRVTVCERKLKLEFDFRQVYWNSRLSEERVKLLAQVEPDDVVLDLFAGVGAFALMCGERGCRVYANDLNPAGAEAIRRNASLNRVALASVFNMCMRACVRDSLRSLERLPAMSQPTRVHVIMNLPAIALDFLDAFRDMAASGVSALFSASPIELIVHCHCFARDKQQPELEVHPRVVEALGFVPEGTRIREVRDVAPKKNMYCVEFSVLLRAGATASGAAGSPSSAPTSAAAQAESAPGSPKRQKCE